MTTLVDYLEDTANGSADSPAYIWQDQSFTYSSLADDINQAAGVLESLGIQKGDRVALLLGNSPEFVISYYSILRIGAAVVPMNPMYTASELEFILSNSGAKAIIGAGKMKAPLLQAKDKLSSLDHVILTGEDLALSSDYISFSSLLDESQVPLSDITLTKDDTAVILYTSGTTGRPKGAILTHENVLSNALATADAMEYEEKDVSMAVLPMFHVFCMTVSMNASLIKGVPIVIMPAFSPKETVAAIQKHQVTLFAGVPTMYNFINQMPDIGKEELSSIRLCISGGASMPVELLKRFQQRFEVPILEGYGLSESAPVTAFNPLRGERKAGSVGVDFPGIRNKVVDPEDREVPRNEVGELIVQGPNVMKGYLNLPEETSMTIRDGWLHTGDLARMDEDGYIYIVDRKKDLIIVGGYNVYPREVEEVIYQHPDVVEAAVLGEPDESYGEKIKAFVVTKNKELTTEDVHDFCSRHLAKFKLPADIEFIEELPKNATGKILKRALKTSS